MINQPIGTGTGQAFTPILFDGGLRRIPVRLAKTNPLYEGYHQPFYVTASEMDKYGDVEIAVEFTGHLDKHGLPSRKRH